MAEYITKKRKMGPKTKTDSDLKSMLLPRFGQMLVNRGIVDEAAIFDALTFQRKKIIPMGALAIRELLLNREKVWKILNAQSNTPKRFGEAAIELGFLKKKDVEYLLGLQVKLRPKIGEILVEMKKMNKERLEQELLNYENLKDSIESK